LPTGISLTSFRSSSVASTSSSKVLSQDSTKLRKFNEIAKASLKIQGLSYGLKKRILLGVYCQNRLS